MKKKIKKEKPINWKKVLAKSKELESKKDVLRVVELIKEIYWIVCVKHGSKKKI